MKLKELIPVYLNHLKTLGRSDLTIRVTKYDLHTFAKFLEEEKVFDIEDLTKDALEEYQQELYFRVTKKGSPLAVATQSKTLILVRGFTRFLKQKEYLLFDPGQGIKLPKKPKRLPKVILSKKEVKQLLNAPDMNTNQGYRDRIILEILYDTAIRRAETASIKVSDLDLKAGYIRINGKGNKERVVPLSERVSELVRNYILFVRPSYLQQEDNGYLVLTYQGKKMIADRIWRIVKHYARVAKLKINVTTHTFRHTCATHMLKNGAPIRHLQEMLGHESLDSTQIYTRVTINDLKEIHAKYHPSDTL